MSSLVEQVESDVSGTFVKHFEYMGVKPTVAEAYMAVFFADRPLGLKDISERTGYSISTVCNAMDVLERLTDIHRSSKPGSKKVYYECLHDIKVMQRKKLEEGHRHITDMISVLKSAELRLAGEASRHAETLLGRIRIMRKDYEDFIVLSDRIEAAFASVGK